MRSKQKLLDDLRKGGFPRNDKTLMLLLFEVLIDIRDALNEQNDIVNTELDRRIQFGVGEPSL